MSTATWPSPPDRSRLGARAATAALETSTTPAAHVASAQAWSLWRAVWRMALMVPVLVVGAATVWGASLVPMPAARRAVAIQALIACCSRWLLRVCSVRVRVVGRPLDGPMLLASNHLSWIDILAAKRVWPDAQLIAKHDVARWPVIGRISRAADTLFVDRSRRRDLLRSIPELHRQLASGRTVLLFAEGTTTDGSETLPFKSSLFEAAVRAQVPVVPVTFRASTGPGGAPVSTHVCWWGETSLLAHLPRVAGTRRIEFTIRLGEPMESGTCRKQLASRAHLAVRSKARHGTRA